MAALWLLCVGVPGGGAETDVPVYQAPQILAPRARLGGACEAERVTTRRLWLWFPTMWG